MKNLAVRALMLVIGFLAAAIAVVAWALTPPAPLVATSKAFTLRDVTIVNSGQGRMTQQSIAVDDGYIRAIAAEDPAGVDGGAYGGMYVLPGLIDMHSHLPPDSPLKLTSYFMLLNLAHGVTTIRDAADVDGTSLPAQRDAERDGYPGPRVFTCGAFVSAGPPRWANTVTLEGPEDAEAAVVELKAAGAHCIKAYDGLTLPMVAALRKAAGRHGLRLMGHVPMDLTYEQALIPDVQHLMGIAPSSSGKHRYLSDGWPVVGDARLRAIVAVTREYGIANTPTLVLGRQILLLENHAQWKDSPEWRLAPRLFRDFIWSPEVGIPTYRDLTVDDFERLRDANTKKLKLVRWLHESGAQLYLGTDPLQPFVIPGQSLHQEMRLFVEAGIPVGDVWDMATRQAAASLRLPQAGAIVSGAPADFLIFREDPTANLSALDSLEAVVSQGRLYTKRDIDAKIAEYQAHYQSFVFDRLSVALARVALRKAVAVDEL